MAGGTVRQSDRARCGFLFPRVHAYARGSHAGRARRTRLLGIRHGSRSFTRLVHQLRALPVPDSDRVQEASGQVRLRADQRQSFDEHDPCRTARSNLPRADSRVSEYSSPPTGDPMTAESRAKTTTKTTRSRTKARPNTNGAGSNGSRKRADLAKEVASELKTLRASLDEMTEH